MPVLRQQQCQAPEAQWPHVEHPSVLQRNQQHMVDAGHCLQTMLPLADPLVPLSQLLALQPHNDRRSSRCANSIDLAVRASCFDLLTAQLDSVTVFFGLFLLFLFVWRLHIVCVHTVRAARMNSLFTFMIVY